MAKCPNCKHELLLSDGKYHCPQCGRVYIAKQQPAAPATQQQQAEIPKPEPQAGTQAAPEPQATQTQDVNNELEMLKARLAALEAEKQQVQTAPKPKSAASAKVSAAMNKVAATPAWAWTKKHWYVIVASLLGLIIFITLLTCLCGIRGIYVNINNPNEFYSFTATSYEYHGTSIYGGGDYTDEGSWKKSGNKLLLTYNDEDFGKITEENIILKNENNKVLVLENEFGMQKTFKRVNIVNYSAVATKVKVTFDANGGLVNNSDKKTIKVKIGGKVQAPTPSKQDCQFMGWYTEPYGYKSGTADMYDQRTCLWENVTYYANWYNPTNYEITLIGEATDTLTAKEGENLLKLLQAKYQDCEFTFNNKKVDSTFTMPAQNIEIKCAFSEAYWQRLEKNFSFYSNSVSCRNENISGDIVIPSNYRGKKITNIGLFMNCTQITSITIPDSVTSIGNSAFKDCTGLTSVTIGNSVTTIYSAFSGCTGLTSITIPDSVTSIGDWAFDGCTGLTSVTIGNSVTSIGTRAFSYCTGLKSITIPNSVTSIGNSAFYRCTGLTSITIPDSVTTIDHYAFNGCSGLTSITIGNGVTNIGYVAFAGCSELKEVYYIGTAEDWAKIKINGTNNNLTYATRYYYSETKPTESGNYWHYVDGVVTVW